MSNATTCTLFIPAFATMMWAAYAKCRQREIKNLIILLLIDTAFIVNAALVHKMMVEQLSVTWHLVQMTACVVILPLIHIYFSRIVGWPPFAHRAARWLWAIAGITYIPQIILYNPFTSLTLPTDGLQPYCLYVLSHGEKLLAIYTGDIAVMLQATLLIGVIGSFAMLLRDNGLRFNGKMRIMSFVLATTVLFSIVASSMDYATLRSTAGTWFYFSGYSLSLFVVNLLIAKGYTVHPVLTEEGQSVENVERYVRNNHIEMAQRLQHMMEEEQLYLDSQLSSDVVIERLYTNHTYLSQMMQEVWGMSFTDYISGLRLKKVEELLAETTLSITEVALKSGFSSPGYMTRKFKAKHGITPSEWRRTRRE